jgi:hypothetical protein
VGPTGSTGPTGPTGAAGIATIATLNGSNVNVGAQSLGFVGSTTTITLTTGQELIASLSLVIFENVITSTAFYYTACAQPSAGGTISTLAVGSLQANPADGTATYPADGVISGLSAGTYKVGICMSNTDAQTGIVIQNYTGYFMAVTP